MRSEVDVLHLDAIQRAQGGQRVLHGSGRDRDDDSGNIHELLVRPAVQEADLEPAAVRQCGNPRSLCASGVQDSGRSAALAYSERPGAAAGSLGTRGCVFRTLPSEGILTVQRNATLCMTPRFIEPT